MNEYGSPIQHSEFIEFQHLLFRLLVDALAGMNHKRLIDCCVSVCGADINSERNGVFPSKAGNYAYGEILF